MKTRSNFKMLCVSLVSFILLVNGCSNDNTSETMIENIMLKEWTGPYGGVPAFDKMNLSEVRQAMEDGMEMSLLEIDEIANNPEQPNFENTIETMEKSGAALDRAFAYYGILTSNMSTPEFRDIQTELAPKISEYSSKISQNKKLFERIKVVHEKAMKQPLEVDKQRVIQLIYEQFAINGAELDDESKKRYAEINKELSTLYTTFSNNVLADEEGIALYLTKDQLGGLSDSFINAIAQAASDRGEDGKYAISNTRSVAEPFLSYSTERALRKKVWENYKSRADNGDEHDNKKIITKILRLRDERVALLGYDNYASWRLQDRMAKTPENAMKLMNAVWPAALESVKREVADMQTVAKKLGDHIKIEPWDYLYYAEKVRKEKYDLDFDKVKPYLQLDKLREAMFFVAGELFKFRFEPVPEGSVPVFHEDVKVWEVSDITTDKFIGLWYLDAYARKGKRSGAWATTYRSHTSFDGDKTVLSSNNSNFIKPAPGDPVLVSWTDAETFFHEFGHALHFLSSNVKYPTLNGGVRDYTEFQSQLLERWLSTDKVINNYLVHYQTGEVIPKDLVAKIKKAATFNQGYKTTEYLSSALVDMKLHMQDDLSNIDIDDFEKSILAELNMPAEIAMRHRLPHFSHIFSGEGYAAAYYGYIWADVLTSDAAEMFVESPGGFYDEEVSAKLVKYLFAPRNTLDPAEAYRLFRGRDASIDAIMRDRGFPLP